MTGFDARSHVKWTLIGLDFCLKRWPEWTPSWPPKNFAGNWWMKRKITTVIPLFFFSPLSSFLCADLLRHVCQRHFLVYFWKCVFYLFIFFPLEKVTRTKQRDWVGDDQIGIEVECLCFYVTVVFFPLYIALFSKRRKMGRQIYY